MGIMYDSDGRIARHDFKRPADILQDGLRYVWQTNAPASDVHKTVGGVIRSNLGLKKQPDQKLYACAIIGEAAGDHNKLTHVGIYAPA